MQGPYDVEFRTISVSRELMQRSLEHQRQLDEEKAAEACPSRETAQPASKGLVHWLLGFARPERHWEAEEGSARVTSTMVLASDSQGAGGRRVPAPE